MQQIANSPVAVIVGCVCIYPVLAFAVGVLFERYPKRYRIVRLEQEPTEGKEV